MKACVYVLWSADQCLYVGCTEAIHTRLGAHARSRGWWDQVDRVEVQGFDELAAARHHEATLIQDLHPAHNVIQHEMKPKSGPPNVTPFTSELASEVRALLGYAGVSSRELASRLDTPYSTLRRRINGEEPFTMDQLEAVAVALGTSIQALILSVRVTA